MSNYIKVAKKSEIGDGEIKRVEVDGKEIALLSSGGQFFALSDVCTHEGCLLSEEGMIEGDNVECLCHGSKFDMKTGDFVNGPAASPMTSYEVKIEGEDILVFV